jgi:hypothetical protein
MEAVMVDMSPQSAAAELPKAPRRVATRTGRFTVRALDVALGSASAKKRPGAHVVGRPFTNYLSLKRGDAAVDVIADRLSNDEFEKYSLRNTLRNAVLLAHAAGSRKIFEHNAEDCAGRTAAALRAVRVLSELVYDPSFIPAILVAAPIVGAENPSYGDQALELAHALDKVTILEAVLADAQRGCKPFKRQNPGKPYMAGFAESLVAFWTELTSEFPSKTRKEAERSTSHRALFWEFVDTAMEDLAIKGQPIDFQVRQAINRHQGCETTPKIVKN